MPRRYPPEFRRRVLDLIGSGRKFADVARDLGVSGQTIYYWRKQDLIDRGERPGLRSEELAELVAARRRITALEAELAATRRAQEPLKEAVLQKVGSRSPSRWWVRATRCRCAAESWRFRSPGHTLTAAGHPLRGRLGCVLPPGGGVVHRRIAVGDARHQRAGHGHPEPSTIGHPDPLRSRDPVHLLGVHRAGQAIGAPALDGLDRRLLR